MEITEDFGDVCREGAPFPEPLLAKLVAVPHHALRQGEIHVVLVAIECFFARYKIPLSTGVSTITLGRFCLRFEKLLA